MPRAMSARVACRTRPSCNRYDPFMETLDITRLTAGLMKKMGRKNLLVFGISSRAMIKAPRTYELIKLTRLDGWHHQ